jgi:hypothetical protein
MSQNMTVSWRRSASWVRVRVRREVIGAAAAGGWAAGPGSSAAAHWPQKRNAGGLSNPQLGQARLSAVPHWPQKRIVAGLSKLQLGHFKRDVLLVVDLGGIVGATTEAGRATGSRLGRSG